jgi:hypothetical protein
MAKTALITGASSGLGVEFARLFAKDRFDLVLVARRKDRLEALASELKAAHGVQARVFAVDLGDPEAVPSLVKQLQAWGVSIDALVNNAGYGTSGKFWELDAEKERAELQVNIMSLHGLTRALLPGMVSRGSGRILNIGSTAGFQPGPFMSTYYASKAFVNGFTEGLSYELRGTGVTATVSCPGATATEFGAVAGNDKSPLFRMGAMNAQAVAAQAYAAMNAGKPLTIHGFKNKFAAFMVRLSPRPMARAIAASLNRSSEMAPVLKS